MSLNKVMLIGNLARDPETSFAPSGMCCCRFTVATTEKWNDKQTGEKKEATEWNKCVLWGKPGESLAQYGSKGRQIYVEGRLKTSKYTKDGVDRYSTDIIVNTFQLLGPKPQGQTSQGQNQGNRQNNGYSGGYPQGQGYQNGPGPGGFHQPPDDSIPFAPNMA